MLRLGKLTDYAMLILSHLAQMPTSILSATMIADTLHLTVPTVSKILKMLSDAGLVSATRGAEGGYRLIRPAAEISIADVIAAMEGGLAMTECCDSISHCTIASMCTMKENWKKINKMVYSLLDGISVVDMLMPLPSLANEGTPNGK